MLNRALGTGSFFYWEARNKWRYRKTVGEKRKKTLTVYAKTKQECVRLMHDKEREYERTERLSSPSAKNAEYVTLQDAMLHWMQTNKYQTGDLKSRSYDTLESTFNTWIKDTSLGRMAISNIYASDIQAHLNMVVRQRSSSTVSKVYSILRLFFTYYYESDPRSSPMVTVKKPRRRNENRILDISHSIDENSIMDDAEIKRFVAECQKPVVRGVSGSKYGNLFVFLIFTMLRYAEVISLTPADIDCENSTIRISSTENRIKKRDMYGNALSGYEWSTGDPKTSAGNRTVYLYSAALNALNRYIAQNCPNIAKNDRIFVTSGGKPISNQHLNVSLRGLLKQAKIDKDISCHDLRHTGVSFYLRKGMPVDVVSKMAGHSDITTTLRIYNHVTNDKIVDAFKRLESDMN